jgi:Protein of Unknown function (DUF2784)
VFARVAADAIVLVHLAFIAFVLFGAWCVLRWKWIAWLHVPAFLWGALVEFLGLECPLTPLEQRARAIAGDAGYSGGFVDHYIVPVMYPAGLTPTVQFWFGVFVVALNAAIYAFAVVRSRRA